MNLSNCSELFGNAPPETVYQDRAFTLTELLVVIAMLAVLALLSLPALAGIQNKGGRVQCADNLRQIGAATMMYASQNQGWLPICDLGSFNNPPLVFNHLGGEHYTRYVWLGTAFTQVPQSGTGFQNLGYLFKTGLAGNGSVFYCPAQWGTLLGANAYLPLLTSDSLGAVRSSYMYNPRMVNAAAGNNLRRYQKTSDLPPHKLFAVDYIENSNPSVPGVDPVLLPHARERGWNVLFTDGSVQFSANAGAYHLVTHNLITDESIRSYQLYDILFNDLEQDH